MFIDVLQARNQSTLAQVSTIGQAISLFNLVIVRLHRQSVCHVTPTVSKLDPSRVETPVAQATFNDCARVTGIDIVSPMRELSWRSFSDRPDSAVDPPE
jgi:hypothetical protein